jgi:hypothetical protein
LAERINKIAKKDSVNRVVSGVCFAVNLLEEHAPKVPYDLTVVLVYAPGMDPQHSGDIAEEAGAAIEAGFRKRCLTDEASGTWKRIRLKRVIAYSEERITVATMIKAAALAPRSHEHAIAGRIRQTVPSLHPS